MYLYYAIYYMHLDLIEDENHTANEMSYGLSEMCFMLIGKTLTMYCELELGQNVKVHACSEFFVPQFIKLSLSVDYSAVDSPISYYKLLMSSAHLGTARTATRKRAIKIPNGNVV